MGDFIFEMYMHKGIAETASKYQTNNIFIIYDSRNAIDLYIKSDVYIDIKCA